MQMNEKQTLLAGAAALALIVLVRYSGSLLSGSLVMPRLPISRLFCRRRLNLHRNPRGKNRGQSTSIPLRPKS